MLEQKVPFMRLDLNEDWKLGSSLVFNEKLHQQTLGYIRLGKTKQKKTKPKQPCGVVIDLRTLTSET